MTHHKTRNITCHVTRLGRWWGLKEKHLSTATRKGHREARTPTPPGEIAKKLRAEYGLSQHVMARLLGVSIKTVSLLESGRGRTVDATLRNLTEVRRLLQALAQIMRAGFVAEWLQVPNEGLGGLKPVEVIERGESDRLWEMIFQVGSGEPL